MKKNSLIYLAAIISAMVFLAVLLYLFEKQNADASIQSLPDALWYTVVTLTTVGYGDYYPVTVPGKAVGIIIVLCSLGVIANIIASIMNILNGNILPELYLKKNRKKTWYVFSESNAGTECLMKSIRKKNNSDDTLVICLSEKGKWNFSWEDIVELKKDNYNTLHLFFMDDTDDDYLNFCNAYKVYGEYLKKGDIPFHVYCLTDYKPDNLSVNLTCFSSYENTARLYWKENPLKNEKEKIIIAGKGRYSGELIRYALQGNIIAPSQNVQYHLFTDKNEFLKRHKCLYNYFSQDIEDKTRDTVIFYDHEWYDEPELTETADRIIFCDDNERVNLLSVSDLRKYFAVNNNCSIHVRSESELEDIDSFGSDVEIFTEELVVREELNNTAVAMNEIYRESCGMDNPDWNHLSEFKRRSNIAASDHIEYKKAYLNAATSKEAYDIFMEPDPAKRKLCRRMEHERWARFHVLNNWVYSAVRDDSRRRHPDLCSFDQLSENEQAKDDYSWEILGKIEETFKKF